jgi:hypothetical protein
MSERILGGAKALLCPALASRTHTASRSWAAERLSPRCRIAVLKALSSEPLKIVIDSACNLIAHGCR